MPRTLAVIVACASQCVMLSVAVAQTNTSAPPDAAMVSRATAIAEKARATMFGLKTFRAECFETHYPTKTVLIAAKLNFMRYETWAMTAPKKKTLFNKWKRKKSAPDITKVSDGKTLWLQTDRRSVWQDDTVDPYELESHSEPGEPWHGFYQRDDSLMDGFLNQGPGIASGLRVDGTDTVDGVLCDVIRYEIELDTKYGSYVSDVRLCIGRDGIIRRKTVRDRDNRGKAREVFDFVIRNVVLNAPITNLERVFSYTLPKGIRVRKPR